MRTFKLMVMVALAFGISACSSEDDDNCGQTSGCQPPPDTCGDDACQAGENAQNCPEDCVPDTCGDGTCSAGDGENAQNCSMDCNVTCVSNSQLPVYCADTNSCWPAGTDCSQRAYTCGEHEYRCEADSDTINCCGGQVYECWTESPYYCPSDGNCYETEAECPDAPSACEVRALSCMP